MAFLIDRINGQNYAENIVNDALSFNDGTWTVASGTGTATLLPSVKLEGNSSLLITNNTPVSDITVTNSDQTTVISYDGDYQISWFLRKNIPLEVRGVQVLIYKNAVLLDTQGCVLGSTDASLDINDIWQRFQSDTTYNLSKGDEITFQFSLRASATSELTTFVWVDAVMLNHAERGNAIVPSYQKTTQAKTQLFGIYDYNDDTTSTTPISVSASTWTALTNDGAGAFTNKTYALNGIVDIWDTSGNLFDFSDLELGDKIEIRLTGIITTTTSNQTCAIRLKAAIGTGSEYSIPFGATITYKTGEAHDLSLTSFITILNTETLNNGARFEVFSDNTADFEVVGWQCVVHKRLI